MISGNSLRAIAWILLVFFSLLFTILDRIKSTARHGEGGTAGPGWSFTLATVLGVAVLAALWWGMNLAGNNLLVVDVLMASYVIAVFGLIVFIMRGNAARHRAQKAGYPPPSVSYGMLLVGVLWNLLSAWVVITAVQRGWYKFGRGENSKIVSRSENPFDFWIRLMIVQAVAVFALAIGLYQVLKQKRADRE